MVNALLNAIWNIIVHGYPFPQYAKRYKLCCFPSAADKVNTDWSLHEVQENLVDGGLRLVKTPSTTNSVQRGSKGKRARHDIPISSAEATTTPNDTTRNTAFQQKCTVAKLLYDRARDILRLK